MNPFIRKRQALIQLLRSKGYLALGLTTAMFTSLMSMGLTYIHEHIKPVSVSTLIAFSFLFASLGVLVIEGLIFVIKQSDTTQLDTLDHNIRSHLDKHYDKK